MEPEKHPLVYPVCEDAQDESKRVKERNACPKGHGDEDEADHILIPCPNQELSALVFVFVIFLQKLSCFATIQRAFPVKATQETN